MNGKIKAVFNWSGGKDSSLALLKALRSGLYDITALLTTVNSAKERSSMHDIPLSLLEKQALVDRDTVVQGASGSARRYARL